MLASVYPKGASACVSASMICGLLPFLCLSALQRKLHGANCVPTVQYCFGGGSQLLLLMLMSLIYHAWCRTATRLTVSVTHTHARTRCICVGLRMCHLHREASSCSAQGTLYVPLHLKGSFAIVEVLCPGHQITPGGHESTK
jgi:hypothetical protein